MKDESQEMRTLRHDLANPTAAILAEVQLMLLDEDKLDQETVQSLKEIERLTRKLKTILQGQ